MSSRDMIVHCKEFDPSTENVEFRDRKELNNGSFRIPMVYRGRRLRLETFRHRNPFGLSRGRPDVPEELNKKITLSLSFDTRSRRGKSFHDAMKSFEDILVQTAYENRVTWGLCRKAQESKKSLESIRDMFNPIVRVAYDKNTGEVIEAYEPTFKVELYTVRDEATGLVTGITTEVYDERAERLTQVDESTIPGGSEAKLIMEVGHVYVVPYKSFGVTWRVRQMRVFPGATLPQGRCLIEDDEPDSEDEAVADQPSDAADEAAEDAAPDDAADEGAEEEEEEDEPPAKPRLSLGARRRAAASK